MSTYSGVLNTKKTSQAKPVPGKPMVKNSAGGYQFELEKFKILERFLILGAESSTYYASKETVLKDVSDNLLACVKSDGINTVTMIKEISVSGRAPKQDPALFALAACLSFGDTATKRFASAAFNDIVRTGTHLFTFAEYVNGMRGWGSTLKGVVSNWYAAKDRDRLAYQLVKYQQRNGWSHRDLLRLSHPNVPALSDLFKYVVSKHVVNPDPMPRIIYAFEKAMKTTSEKELVRLIEENPGLTHEMLPTQFLKSADVWSALLPNMGATALLRSLGRITATGLLKPLSNAAKLVVNKLNDLDFLRNGRVHPIGVLSASAVYDRGRGVKGDLTWTPNQNISKAIEDAFYASFQVIEPTGKNFMLGIDVSGSMTTGAVAGLDFLTPNAAAGVMAMVTARVEKNSYVVGFSDRVVDLGIKITDDLKTTMRKCQRNFGATDCGAAIEYAIDNKLDVDTFVVYSDSESWSGGRHVFQAMDEYIKKHNPNAKLVGCNLVANASRITVPNDSRYLDVVGFDSAAPQVISNFARG